MPEEQQQRREINISTTQLVYIFNHIELIGIWNRNRFLTRWQSDEWEEQQKQLVKQKNKTKPISLKWPNKKEFSFFRCQSIATFYTLVFS